MKSYIAVALSLMLLGCQSSEGSGTPRCDPYDAAKVACEVSMVAVLANPDLYEFKDIAVSGFLGGDSTPGTLYLSREAWATGDDSSALLLASEDAGVRESGARFKFAHVVVSGRLIGDDRKLRQPALMLSTNRIVLMARPEAFTDGEVLLMDGMAADSE